MEIRPLRLAGRLWAAFSRYRLQRDIFQKQEPVQRKTGEISKSTACSNLGFVMKETMNGAIEAALENSPPVKIRKASRRQAMKRDAQAPSSPRRRRLIA